MRVLVTGASGFVGRALVGELAAAGHGVRAAMREPADIFPRAVEVVAVSDLARSVDWPPLLKGVDTVVHLAGIAHAGPGIAEESYDRVNRQATEELARAIRAGAIRRLVFVSSIRAQSGSAAPYILRESDEPHPTDAYGRSKLAAEQAIRASGAPFTILRPVLVYGPGVKGNLERLTRMALAPVPLPFALFRNRRSLVARQNLNAAIHFALASPAAERETYIVADPESPTLAELVAALRAGAGRTPGLLPVPPKLFEVALRAMGRGEDWERLGGSLVADSSKLMHAGWKPVVETRAGLAAMAQAASPLKSGTASRSTR